MVLGQFPNSRPHRAVMGARKCVMKKWLLALIQDHLNQGVVVQGLEGESMWIATPKA